MAALRANRLSDYLTFTRDVGVRVSRMNLAPKHWYALQYEWDESDYPHMRKSDFNEWDYFPLVVIGERKLPPLE